jgi:NADP-dependent 3-hydroxy acid dehydrogenase YdfG
LGKAVTELLAQAGWKVFALARFKNDAEFPKNVMKLQCNIRDLKEIDAAFAQIDRETDHIDLLINCAGRALVKTFEDTTREEIMDIFGVNLKGNIYIAHEVYTRMLPKKAGHIINVSSTSGLRAREMEVLYCASKWGLRGFTESLRLEARKHGISVTGVYPGGMSSENFWQVLPDKDISVYMKPVDVAKQIMNVVNQGSGVTIAELVVERP